jgi:hypothetical protein
MIFASGLILDREPLQWSQLPAALIDWVQTAGAFAALGLVFWVLVRFLQRERATLTAPGPSRLYALLIVLAWAGYGVIILLWFGAVLGLTRLVSLLPGGGGTFGDYLITFSGACALAAVLAPLVVDIFTRLRWRRIWAMARLSLKEAIRNRAVLIFAAMALVFLFADWFVPYRAEDQVRNYVRVVYWSMIPLFLLTAGLLGAFSIPNDVKSQSIHTIVTKPVEKFEVVLGRFLGYAILLTVGLMVITGLSLLYVVQGVTENAQQESYKARVPVFGSLSFYGARRSDRGESVGREWDYRSYIEGPRLDQNERPVQYAIWEFHDVPSDLGSVDEQQVNYYGKMADEFADMEKLEKQAPEQGGASRWVKFEFTFDIFRLSKGEENKDIPCTFTLVPGGWSTDLAVKEAEKVKQEYTELDKAARAKFEQNKGDQEKAQQDYKADKMKARLDLVEKHRFYQISGIPVTDYHTQTLMVPRAFFKAVQSAGAPGVNADGKRVPIMQVMVNVDRHRESQMLGVAQRDLYLLAAEKPFWQNFLKGVIGMWCTFILVLGIAIACSTYLSGVITWICTMFLFCAGLFTDYLHQIAEGRLYGGGPTEAMYRLLGNRPIGAPIDNSPAATVLRGSDQVFSWWVRRFLALVPDVSRYDLHQYVANGFDIGWTQVLLVDNLLPLVGYLLPWAVLAYYLMKYREIANPS